ncbi:hypothetical protein F383_28342 [Gossypium arboreum]|uniref:Uncharacterized protein n=1 Tax=Gossypium arboreum TaxID=29729 RepID=A0A0B0MS31_GOSAR|nr:hypothetical protein F383_28342 [Gossypium arboreum]
MLAYGGVSVA